MARRSSPIYIGTSGWSYDHWEAIVYPSGLSGEQRLHRYAQRLPAVEINHSFYQLPEALALARWRETVPEGFRFAVKASRYITHMKKLKDPESTLPGLLERVDRLGDRLGPLLFQLPPRWRFNGARLEAFLEGLPAGYPAVFEFRDPSWHNEQTIELLERYGAGFVVYELEGFESPLWVTGDQAYVRLHGPDGAYRGDYPEATLATWAERLQAWAREGYTVYCFFDNDEAGYAAKNAETLRRLCHPG
jgi:uncharacterized protein YecE (DUF72 family)